MKKKRIEQMWSNEDLIEQVKIWSAESRLPIATKDSNKISLTELLSRKIPSIKEEFRINSMEKKKKKRWEFDF